MTAKTVATLYELFVNADETKQMLRVDFVGGETYNLIGFAVCQDIGEEYPHCTAISVRPIEASAEKMKRPSTDTAMFFHLNDVAEVHETLTGKLLFKS